MTIVFEISMSLDGYVTAAGVRAGEPMGDGGQQLHEWAFGGDGRGREVLAGSVSTVGRASPGGAPALRGGGGPWIPGRAGHYQAQGGPLTAATRRAAARPATSRRSWFPRIA
jgi:hypothetical protein